MYKILQKSITSFFLLIGKNELCVHLRALSDKHTFATTVPSLQLHPASIGSYRRLPCNGTLGTAVAYGLDDLQQKSRERCT